LEVRGTNVIRINDLLIGEVWLCSGQSNMQMPLNGAHGGVIDAANVVAHADDPTLRMYVPDEPFAGNRTAVPPTSPAEDRPGKWIVCTPRTAAEFTAIGYFFARRVQDQIHMPMGLLNASVGGTPIEAWTSLSAQQAVPELQPMLADWQTRLRGYDPLAAKQKAADARAKWIAERDAARAAGQPAPKAPRQAVFRNAAIDAPAGLFNGMISPLIPYTIRGALWYQGEANSGEQRAQIYGKQLQTLIGDWRKRWGDDFYFSYVQLPGLTAQQTVPIDDAGRCVWTREGQRQTLAVIANTSMAITIDLSGPAPILHPQNKDAFANRLALLALHDVYHQGAGPASGPLYRQVRWDGGRMIVSFNYASGLLAGGGVAKGDPTRPKGFAIAGADHKFVWADARIDHDEVIVWSDSIPHPLAVRYDWAANPIGDLENQAHLPCSPFRTDDWPAVPAPAAQVTHPVDD
jgi:sialate O-acetylesterase